MDEQQKLLNQFKKKSISLKMTDFEDYTNKQFKANIKVPHSKTVFYKVLFSGINC